MTRRRALTTLLIIVAIAWGSLAAVLMAGLEPKLGLDLQGGFSVVLVAPEGTDEATLDQAVEVMRRRIENLGSVQEPEISVEGDRRIRVQLPGVDDRERALQAVGTTGEMAFRPVYGFFFESPALSNPELDHPPGLDPVTGLSIVDDPNVEVYLASEVDEDTGVVAVYHLGPVFLTGADLQGGRTQLGGHSGTEWVVVPEFTSEGGDKFREATKILAAQPLGSPTRQMAIIVDGIVISAPVVQEDVSPLEGLDPDRVVITIGNPENPQAEAEDLASFLRYGALPTTFERERVESVSASLGSDSLKAGLIAGIGGLMLVAIYMFFYYRSLGLIAIFGLSVFGSILLTTMILLGEFMGVTLTLAGVTGVIVSIGITSDSYIVYFERTKEEHRRGRALRPAVDHAFSGAFRTILTGDTVTFMGAVLLWLLAIGPVKGFALTLGLATVIDVIVAYYFTRPAAVLMVRSPLGEGGWFSIRGAMGRSKDEAPAESELAEVAP